MDSNNLFSDYFSDDLDSSPTVPTVVTTTTTTTATWWLEEADHRGEAVLYTEENPYNNNIEVSTRHPLLPHPNTLGFDLPNASLARSCSSSRIPASAKFASSVATQQSSSGLGGLFGWLAGDRSNSLPSLDFRLLGVILPPSLPNFVAPGKTIITTLPNGLKVASETSPVNEQLLKVKAEIGEASKNPQDLLLEAIHSAGFSGALANPLLASESALNRLNGTILEEFVTLGNPETSNAEDWMGLVDYAWSHAVISDEHLNTLR
ncbi:Mitochondrial-processing peptidase subunit alpha [Glycine max]|nr:Mitochondrial-processing peptidase subunit alpha [Glycine max]